VTGKVTVKGQSIAEKCGVLFQAPSTGYTATGEIQPDGTYSLSFEGSKQIPAVEYVVQFSGPPVELAPPSSGKGPAPIVVKPAPFHSRYKTTATSNLKFTVQAGTNQADFDLEK